MINYCGVYVLLLALTETVNFKPLVDSQLLSYDQKNVQQSENT